MSLLLRIVWLIIGHRAKLKMVTEAKRHGVIAYLKVLQGSRRALVALLVAGFILQLMILSFVGALVIGVWLLELEAQTKLIVLFGIFASLFSIPAALLAYVLSERVWYKASGAEKIVESLHKSA